MRILATGSDDEGTKIRSGIANDERVNEGNCRGTLKDRVSTTIDGGMGCWTELAWREADVVVKV